MNNYKTKAYNERESLITFLLPSRFTRAKDYNYIPGEWNYTTNCLYQNKVAKAPQLVLLLGGWGLQMGELGLGLGLGLGSIQDTKTGPHLREKRKRTRKRKCKRQRQRQRKRHYIQIQRQIQAHWSMHSYIS